MQGKAFCKTWHNIALDISIFCAVKNIQTTQVNFVVSLYNIQTPADKDKQTCSQVCVGMIVMIYLYLQSRPSAFLKSQTIFNEFNSNS